VLRTHRSESGPESHMRGRSHGHAARHAPLRGAGNTAVESEMPSNAQRCPSGARASWIRPKTGENRGESASLRGQADHALSRLDRAEPDKGRQTGREVGAERLP
jgi:hypothetical protein